MRATPDLADDAVNRASGTSAAEPPRTVVEMLLGLAERGDRGHTFLDDALSARHLSFAQLVAQVRSAAFHLKTKGLVRGDRVALVISDPLEFVRAFFASIWLGCVPVPMAPPRGSEASAAYRVQAAGILGAAQCRAVVADPRWHALFTSLTAGSGEPFCALAAGELGASSSSELAPHLPDPSDLCFLQFTSGSTASPRGVLVTHGNLVANAAGAMQDWLKARDEDVCVSWLPLYHDMGLIGFVIAPLLTATPVVFIPTLSFVRRPSVWMRTVHAYRGTITVSPNFGLALAAARAHSAGEVDLSCLRVVGCGAEPINPQTLEVFVRAHQALGLAANVVSPLYGLAEATLLVTSMPPEAPPRVARIDAEIYEREKRVELVAEAGQRATLSVVSCGRAIPRHEVTILSEHGEPLGEGQVGEVTVRGPSCTPGYLGAEPRGGALHTGDLGFLLAGELFISGRKKDLIILRGRNLYPQVIEWEVGQVAGVRPGAVVAFAVPGESSEELVVVLEATGESSGVAAEVGRRLDRELGVNAMAIEVVPAGSLPKTSSGKLQRSLAQRHWLAVRGASGA